MVRTSSPPFTVTVGTAPSLPSWVPAPGEVAALTEANGQLANRFDSQCAPYYDPFYYVNTVNDYSTAFKNPYWGTYGATVFWGGGHGGTNDNTVTVAEYGKDQITFKRASDPTPWFGSTPADAGENSAGDMSSPSGAGNQAVVHMDVDYYDSLLDGQPGSPHSYACGNIIGPEHGGAAYGTLLQIASSAVGKNNDYGAIAAHQIRFDTLTLQNASGVGRKWTRLTNNRPVSWGPSSSPHYTAFVSAQNRVYYFSQGGGAPYPVRWFDRSSDNYVVGSGTGFNIDAMDGYDNGIVFHVPTRQLLVAIYRRTGTLTVEWMSVAAAQPTLGTPVTLSQPLAVPLQWAAAAWCPDSERIVLIGISGDVTAAYEITIPTTLSDPWEVTRAPFGAGQTLAPPDPTLVNPAAITYKKWFYDDKVKAIVYMPLAKRSPDPDTVWVYRPRFT